MKRFYFDASAFIKRYANEPGTSTVLKLLQDATNVYTASIAYAECVISFSRKQFEGELREEDVQRLLQLLDEDWEKLDRVELTEPVFKLIKERCRLHRLRTLDAIHLASALLLYREGLEIEFVCSDNRLKKAAEDEGLKVIDPTEE